MSVHFRIHESTGGVCCDNPDPTLRCPKCQAHAGVVGLVRSLATDTAHRAQDPYRAPLTAMRASAMTPLRAFEEEWKTSRRKALAAEYARSQS
jgi:hypothetical protein